MSPFPRNGGMSSAEGGKCREVVIREQELTWPNYLGWAATVTAVLAVVLVLLMDVHPLLTGIDLGAAGVRGLVGLRH